ncbi:protein AUXIN SIGNALING F-BOX 3 [Sesamum alatum]|uniref:Protein AUXIN SIGNALING F-BOX 3 n=1 Tax=Sesamum alatum TaxID=300844 RepID=A0AAE2CKZ4_9LAMI|nr:protein AUXIN SIGNALING F-BOX 3 [Sesamum alatum]
MAKSGINLEELRLKRMVVSDESLELLAKSFPNFKSLVLVSCEGFTTDGLATIASNCRVQELRVFPSDPYGLDDKCCTDYCGKKLPQFLFASGCAPLTPLFQMQLPIYHLMKVSGAIVQSCKGLKRLSVSGLLTDQVFLYIGMYAEQLEMLSIAFAGDSDKGMLYVLNGCKKLKKLEIRDSPFGNVALLADVGKYETMRSLWMSSCEVTFGACKILAKKMPRLNVEIINEGGQIEASPDDKQRVEKMYLYRTMVGPRKDSPDFVWTL